MRHGLGDRGCVCDRAVALPDLEHLIDRVARAERERVLFERRPEVQTHPHGGRAVVTLYPGGRLGIKAVQQVEALLQRGTHAIAGIRQAVIRPGQRLERIALEDVLVVLVGTVPLVGGCVCGRSKGLRR
ncbi:MAG: hypothetical protein AAGI37_05465 [Planctomycetota bacterium]